MNRSTKRQMKKQMTQSDYIKLLEHDNANLHTENQTLRNMTQALLSSSSGNTPIIYPASLEVSHGASQNAELLNDAYQQGYNKGIIDGQGLQKTVQTLFIDMYGAYQMIAGLAQGANGKQTRSAISNVLGKLVTATHHYESGMRQLGRQEAIYINIEGLQETVALITQAREVVQAYLEESSKDNFIQIGEFFSQYSPAHQTISDELSQVRDFRGRNVDPIKRTIGKLAGKYDTKARWEIVREISNDIINIPERVRTDDQQSILDCFIDKGWVEVDPLLFKTRDFTYNKSVRNRAGQYIKEAMDLWSEENAVQRN